MRFRKKVTYISFVLSILVIYIHAYSVETYQIALKSDFFSKTVVIIESYTNTLFNHLCVPFFFTLSGYLFFRTFTIGKLLDKYRSRIGSLVVPYVIWCTLYFLFYYLLTHIPITQSVMNMSPVQLTFKEYINVLLTSKYTTLWFVRELIVLVFLSPLYYYTLKIPNRKFGWILPVITFVIIFLVLNQVIPINIVGFNIYFALGSFCGINFQKFVENPSGKKMKFGIAGFIVGLLLIPLSINSGALMMLITLLLIISVWFGIDGLHFEKEPKWYVKISFFIYCTHSILLEGLQKCFYLINSNSTLFSLISYLVIPLVVVVIISVIAYFMMKKMLPLWNLVNGNRGMSK